MPRTFPIPTWPTIDACARPRPKRSAAKGKACPGADTAFCMCVRLVHSRARARAPRSPRRRMAAPRDVRARTLPPERPTRRRRGMPAATTVRRFSRRSPSSARRVWTRPFPPSSTWAFSPEHSRLLRRLFGGSHALTVAMKASPGAESRLTAPTTSAPPKSQTLEISVLQNPAIVAEATNARGHRLLGPLPAPRLSSPAGTRTRRRRRPSRVTISSVHINGMHKRATPWYWTPTECPSGTNVPAEWHGVDNVDSGRGDHLVHPFPNRSRTDPSALRCELPARGGSRRARAPGPAERQLPRPHEPAPVGRRPPEESLARRRGDDVRRTRTFKTASRGSHPERVDRLEWIGQHSPGPTNTLPEARRRSPSQTAEGRRYFPLQLDRRRPAERQPARLGAQRTRSSTSRDRPEVLWKIGGANARRTTRPT